jgi:hypothetical protein
MFVSCGWVSSGFPADLDGNRTSLSLERQTATPQIDMPTDVFSRPRPFGAAGLLQELRVRGFKTVVFVPRGSAKPRD